MRPVEINLALRQLWSGQLNAWGGKRQQNGQGEVQAQQTCASTLVCVTAIARTSLITLSWL